MVLRSLPKSEHEEVMRVVGRLGMKKFAGAVMYVLQSVFAMPDAYLLCTPDEKEGDFLLSEILQAGNFGRYDERANGEYNTGTLSHSIYKIKRNIRLSVGYSSEVLWAGYFFVLQNYGLWRIGLKNS